MNRLKGEVVLLVIDRGLTRGPVPLRDVALVHREGAEVRPRETLLRAQDLTQGFAEQIAEWFMGQGVAVEDEYHPLPGFERPDTTAEDRRPRRRKGA